MAVEAERTSQAVLSGLREALGGAASAELRALGCADAARDLASTLDGDGTAAARLAAAAYRAKADGGGAFPSPAWREAYAAGQLVAGVAALAAGDAEDALERADLALIVAGAPPGLAGPLADAALAALPPEEGVGAAALGVLPAAPIVEVPDVAGSEPVARRRAAGLGVADFKAEYYRADEPVVLAGAADAWPALSRWRDLGWLAAQHGRRRVPLEVGEPGAAGWREEVCPLGAFMREHLAPGAPRAAEVAYLAQHTLFDQLPELKRDFDVPPYVRACGSDEPSAVCAWIGTAGTVTPCHFDGYDTLLAQVVGYKFVRLFAESDTPYLYRSRRAWSAQRGYPDDDDHDDGHDDEGGSAGGGNPARGSFSRVDVEAPDLQRFPLFERARQRHALLGPGDVLYIPAGCWHHVRALSVSASVSFLM